MIPPGTEKQQPPRLSVIELSKQARQKLRARKFSEACSLFMQGLEREPENPYLLSGLGDAAREMGRFDTAERCYQKLLLLDENNLFALRGLGDVYKKLNRHQSAVELWQRYLVMRSQDKHVMTRIADSLKTLLQYDAAEEWYRKILEFAPKDRFALSGLADLQHRVGNDHEAIRTYEQILAFDSRELHILTIVGKLCWRISDFERAERCFRRALEIDPNNPYALYGLGNCYRWHRQYRQAIDVWQRILDHSAGTQTLHTRMGDAYCHLGEKDAAASAYRKSLTFGRDPFAMAGLICLAAEAGDLDQAAARFHELVVADGDPLNQLDLLGKRFARSESQEPMQALYRHVINGGTCDSPLDADLLSALEKLS